MRIARSRLVIICSKMSGGLFPRCMFPLPVRNGYTIQPHEDTGRNTIFLSTYRRRKIRVIAWPTRRLFIINRQPHSMASLPDTVLQLISTPETLSEVSRSYRALNKEHKEIRVVECYPKYTEIRQEDNTSAATPNLSRWEVLQTYSSPTPRYRTLGAVRRQSQYTLTTTSPRLRKIYR